jgi:hypothetical protein
MLDREIPDWRVILLLCLLHPPTLVFSEPFDHRDGFPQARTLSPLFGTFDMARTGSLVYKNE